MVGWFCILVVGAVSASASASVSGFLLFGSGLWIVDYGLWIVDCGLWIVDCGLWIMDCVGVHFERMN